MPRTLHIIRHGAVVIDKAAQAADWSLSRDTASDVLALVDRFDQSRLRRIVTSREKKARQTGQILARALGLPIETCVGLEEHHRCEEGFLKATTFRALVEDFFARPNELVFGEESACRALLRFETAVQDLMNETGDDELIVSHGRVISLFLASRQRSTPMQIWSSLRLPDHRAVNWSSTVSAMK